MRSILVPLAMALPLVVAASFVAAAPPATVPTDDVSALTEKIEIGADSPARVKRILGEPMSYVWNNLPLDPTKLPETYIMYYPVRVGILVSSGRVREVRFNWPGYRYLGKIGVGSTTEEVIAALGKPDQTVKGQPISWINGVFYDDANGKPGMAYYERAERGCRVFMINGKVTEMSLEVVREPPPAPATAPATRPAAMAPRASPGKR